MRSKRQHYKLICLFVYVLEQVESLSREVFPFSYISANLIAFIPSLHWSKAPLSTQVCKYFFVELCRATLRKNLNPTWIK
jgi:hypothetical protein